MIVAVLRCSLGVGRRTICSTLSGVSRALHVRLDPDAEAALAVLRAEGMNDSQAVRSALSEARARRRRRSNLRDEAQRLAADPADRAELAALREEFDGLAPPWPAD
jgi:hypothetical protein